MLNLTPRRRRIVYSLSYEVIAVFATAAFLLVFNFGASGSLLMGVISSTVAVIWNFLWNLLLETWEERTDAGPRTPLRRAVQDIGFEGGLALWLTPIEAWILNVSLLTALALEAGQLVFFLFYTYAFSWVFDHYVCAPPVEQKASASIH